MWRDVGSSDLLDVLLTAASNPAEKSGNQAGNEPISLLTKLIIDLTEFNKY